MSANTAFKLQDAGFTRQQVEALAEFMDTQAASKADLEKTEHRLDLKITKLDGDMNLVKWMLGLLIAGGKAPEVGGPSTGLLRMILLSYA